MADLSCECIEEEAWRAPYAMDDYVGSTLPRWCPSCGDHGILTAVQRLCRDEQLPPEKTVFVSGIGCASRFPHYMNTYGFHGLHGRALPVAQGIKIHRPDLHVFVVTGDGDCCSIGAGHWLHAIRYNMNMTVLMHDNFVYGLTKNQTSPTSPRGLKSNTSPRGSVVNPLSPIAVTLSVANVSYVAQAVDWIPDLLYQVIRHGFEHKGFSFIRVMQRCPKFTPALFTDLMSRPEGLLLLSHKNGIQIPDAVAKVYKNHLGHDPSNMAKARQIADITDRIPIGVLYQTDRPCYEDLHQRDRSFTPEIKQAMLEREFDKFAISVD
jgi:2-oxoglutarate ferredoxin oxidoreductase subunit beta